MTTLANITTLATLIRFDLGVARYANAPVEAIDARIATIEASLERATASGSSAPDAVKVVGGRFVTTTKRESAINSANGAITSLNRLKELRGL